MAAYAAVISLKKTINGLLNSCCISSTQEILESAYNEATLLQQVLERSNDSRRSSHERLDGLEGQIRDFANKLEDVLEFHELNSDEDDTEVMRQEISSFGKAVKKMEEDYIDELSKGDNGGGGDAILSRINDFGVEMVGHSSQFTMFRYYILRRMRPVDLWFCAFYGKDGTGRRMGAKMIFKDARDGRCVQIFDCCAWVTVSPKHELKEVMIRIISQVDNLAAEADYKLLICQEDEKLSKHLYKLLKNRRYMIVLDDVDNVELVSYLRSNSFPDQRNGSLVFLTTTLSEVAKRADELEIYRFIPIYFKLFMWNIMRQAIYGIEESISEEMRVATDIIIQNCGCLLIPALKTLLFLSKSDKTVDEWSKIAAAKQNPIFTVEDEISEIRQIKMEMQYCNTRLVEIISPMLEGLDKGAMMKMQPQRFFSRMQIMSVFGMAGIGKTTFVRNLFKDKLVLNHFDYHVWITLGQNYQTEEILLDILAQIYPDIHVKLGDEKLVRNLCERLSSKRCLIVLDDLWSKDPLLHLRNLFPDIMGTTLVTTRVRKVAEFEINDHHLEIQLLDKEESWRLLHLKVFGGGLCSPELEKAGRKIAEKCDGLPLLILTVADELLKVEMSQEYWNNVAIGKEKSVFMKAHHKISKALLPSYQSLPQHLKPCFLYVGVFREKCEIPISNLTNLLIAEGFLEPYQCQSEEDFVAQCLCELLDISLVMVQRKVYDDFQIKTCRLHSVFWHLSNSQAVKNKIFHAMNCYDDCSIESIKSQRRLCIRNSILLGMKDVQNLVAFNTTAHSFLCVSPLHQYPVPLNFDLRLLRVMNAVTIRVYEFPIEVVRLVHLRYLGLTCNGKLPTSISNLWMLQFLIVNRYMNIKSSKNSSLLPVEIWDMKELKHLQIMGGCLPNHTCGAGLLKLSTLLDVSVQSCRKKVLKWIPNLKRLGIRIELAPDDDAGISNSFSCLNNISLLGKLESLKCVVVNPRIRSDVSPPSPISMFPQSLKELSLSGLGYPWEYMSIIGKLENLEVLKLKCYAFQGPKWEFDHTCLKFEKLKFLLVEDTDLVQWKTDFSFAMNLECLFIKHCYKLQELPILINSSFRKIQIVDCSPLTVTWAVGMGNLIQIREINAHSSWVADTRKEGFPSSSLCLNICIKFMFSISGFILFLKLMLQTRYNQGGKEEVKIKVEDGVLSIRRDEQEPESDNNNSSPSLLAAGRCKSR